ncbi:MAG: hypothetical protein AB8I08_08895 [Sandaracinaceae bacterium]
MAHHRRPPPALLLLLLSSVSGLGACGSDEACTSDGECSASEVCIAEACVPRASADAGRVDAGRVDAGSGDAGPADAGPPDAGLADAGEPDAGPPAMWTAPARDWVCASTDTPPCATTEPSESEAARTVELLNDFDGDTLTYVLSALSAPDDASALASAGFNLDGMNSGPGFEGDCETFSADFSGIEDSSHRGVDNAYQRLLATIDALLDAGDCGGSTDGCLERSLSAEIAAGRFVVLIEIDGVDSLDNDDDVRVSLYEGSWSSSEAPSTEDGTLAPGQSFETERTIVDAAVGDIYRGRLRVRTPSATLPTLMGLAAGRIPRELDRVELRFDVEAASLGRGILGARTDVDVIVASVIGSDPSLEETVRGVLDSLADVSPSADNPQVCDAVSVGYVLGAVSAVRVP